MNIIDQQECEAYDNRGNKRKTTLALIDTGIVINGQPVIEWSYVSPPGVVFAKRGMNYNTCYPKKPKCDEKYWRREPRTKVKPNWDLINLKLEGRDMDKRIAHLNTMITEVCDKFSDACVMVKGLIATQKTYLATMRKKDERVTAKLKEWSATKNKLQTDLETLKDSRTFLMMMRVQHHNRCLDIRQKERA